MATPPDAIPFLGLELNGQYEVVEYIHEGHFCFVFKGTDKVNGSAVAVKILKPGADAPGVLEFEDEARLLTLLEAQSNVVTCHGSGFASILVTTTAGIPFSLPVRFTTLEHADASLARLLPRRDEIPWFDRLALFRDVVKGVHQMHRMGVVHRDIKADNVLIFQRPNGLVRAKIADLGRSRQLAAPPRHPHDYALGRGDMGFASPELLWLQGEDVPECWRRVDLYQLGSIFFEIATGQGLTTLALGDWRTIVGEAWGMTPADRTADFCGQISDLRSRFEGPYELFCSALPRACRDEALRLIRQLTDPDPERRERRGFGASKHSPWNMEWLLKRVDILSLLVETSKPTQRKRKAS